LEEEEEKKTGLRLGAQSRRSTKKAHRQYIVLYTNAQSLVNKVNELTATASDLNPDLILVTETWCRSDVTDAYLAVPGYKLQADLCKDREDTTNGVGGGLLVYAKLGLALLPGDDEGVFTQHTCFKLLTCKDILNIILLY